jgi:hypothetical protein
MVFCPYLASNCSVVTQKSYLALPANEQLSAQVWPVWVSNRALYLSVERVSRPYISSDCNVPRVTSHFALPAHVPHSGTVKLKPVSTERHFSLHTKQLFVAMSPAIAARSLEPSNQPTKELSEGGDLREAQVDVPLSE